MLPPRKIEWRAVRKELTKLGGDAAEFAACFPDDNPPKVWKVTYNFGEALISNGRIDIPPRHKRLLWKELTYRGPTPEDPLGIVLKGHIEVYTHSNITFRDCALSNQFFPPKSNEDKPRIPLRLIKQGEMFGVFGTLNTIVGSRTPVDVDWHVATGRACLVLLGHPLIVERTHKGNLPKWCKDFLSSRNEGVQSKDVKNRIIEIVQETITRKIPDLPKTELYLFPSVWIEEWIKNNDKALLHLHNVGWKQASDTLYASFENRKIELEVQPVADKKLSSEAQMVIERFCSHLMQAADGNSPVLLFIHLSEEVSTIQQALNDLRSQNQLNIKSMAYFPVLRVGEYRCLQPNESGITSPMFAPLLTGDVSVEQPNIRWYQAIQNVVDKITKNRSFEFISKGKWNRTKNEKDTVASLGLKGVDQKNKFLSYFVKVTRAHNDEIIPPAKRTNASSRKSY